MKHSQATAVDGKWYALKQHSHLQMQTLVSLLYAWRDNHDFTSPMVERASRLPSKKGSM